MFLLNFECCFFRFSLSVTSVISSNIKFFSSHLRNSINASIAFSVATPSFLILPYVVKLKFGICKNLSIDSTSEMLLTPFINAFTVISVISSSFLKLCKNLCIDSSSEMLLNSSYFFSINASILITFALYFFISPSASIIIKIYP